MKMKFGTDKIFYLLILSYFAYIIIRIINHQSNPFVGFGSPETVIYHEDLKPIDEYIPDTIPFNEYKKRKDSTLILRNLKNGNGYMRGSSSYLPGWIGTWSCMDCDTCSLKWLKSSAGFNDDRHNQNYILLSGWTLNVKGNALTQTSNERSHFWTGVDSVDFYIKNGQAYVRKVVKKNYLSKDGSNYSLVDVPVKFRYNTEHKCLMIPISATVKLTLDIIFLCFAFSLFGYIITLFLKCIAFISDLAKGRSFTEQNVKSLKFIGLSLMIYPLALLLLNLFTWLIFRNYFTTDVVLSDVYITLWKIILIGFVFYVLYRAFKAGKALKDEHDLTV